MSISSLVPLPRSVRQLNGPHFCADSLRVEAAPLLDPVATMVRQALSSVLPATSSEDSIATKHSVFLAVDPDFNLRYPGLADSLGRSPNEAYRIAVDKDLVQITARTELGLVRAAATFLQLMEAKNNGTIEIPPCVIEDAPRYQWRGLSMDVSRSFFPVNELKKLVDLLAFYRMNTLHLHLSDDQGWRLEVPQLPKLTEISGSTAVRGGRSGFYTADEFHDLSEHAAKYGVTVIPEFDVPGHTNAAAHAYGELMPDGNAPQSYSGSQVGFSRLYPEVPFTKQFMVDIFDQAAALTRSEYVHIGGDEALEQSADEYRKLIDQAVASVVANGKNVVGWQEIAAADLPAGSIVQYWKTTADPTPIVAAVADGHEVLMSPAPHTYLDLKYDAATPYGQDWAGFVELSDAYQWDPTEQIDGVTEDNIVGVEAGMWTETIHTFDELMYMLLPRLAALAEVGWTRQDDRKYEDFRARIATHPNYWDRAGLKWHRSPGVVCGL